MSAIPVSPSPPLVPGISVPDFSSNRRGPVIQPCSRTFYSRRKTAVRPPPHARPGFTLFELIVVMLVIGILAFVALPRLSLSVFREQGYFQQSSAAIRFAQKQAIASGCNVQVSLTGSSCTLSWSNPAADSSCPANGSALNNPSTAGTDFCPDSVPAASGGLPAIFTFDRIGRPSAGQTISLGDRTIVVEAETGYTHEN